MNGIKEQIIIPVERTFNFLAIKQLTKKPINVIKINGKKDMKS